MSYAEMMGHDCCPSDDYYDSMDGPPSKKARKNARPFTKNPNYYHIPVTFSEIITESPKAYLVTLKEYPKVGEVWIPKSLVRDLVDDRCLIYGKYYYDILVAKMKTLGAEKEVE